MSGTERAGSDAVDGRVLTAETLLVGARPDAWLAEHEAESGPFDEAKLQELAAEVGVAHLPPVSGRTVA